MEKKEFTIALTEEQMKWVRVALNREGDLQEDKDKVRSDFLYDLAEKIH